MEKNREGWPWHASCFVALLFYSFICTRHAARCKNNREYFSNGLEINIRSIETCHFLLLTSVDAPANPVTVALSQCRFLYHRLPHTQPVTHSIKIEAERGAPPHLVNLIGRKFRRGLSLAVGSPWSHPPPRSSRRRAWAVRVVYHLRQPTRSAPPPVISHWLRVEQVGFDWRRAE